MYYFWHGLLYLHRQLEWGRILLYRRHNILLLLDDQPCDSQILSWGPKFRNMKIIDKTKFILGHKNPVCNWLLLLHVSTAPWKEFIIQKFNVSAFHRSIKMLQYLDCQHWSLNNNCTRLLGVVFGYFLATRYMYCTGIQTCHSPCWKPCEDLEWSW